MKSEALDDNLNEIILHSKHYKTLQQEIAISKKHILSLNENWDGENSKGFSSETLKRATEFLDSFFQGFYLEYKKFLEIPTILPVGDLSIDIHWKTKNMELTINFAGDYLDFPSFYGKDDKGNEIQGILDLNKIYIVIYPWLKNFC